MATTLYNHASNLENANGSSGTFQVPGSNRVRDRLHEGLDFIPMGAFPVVVNANVTAFAGTTPSVTFIFETTWDGGQTWVQVWTSGPITATGAIAPVTLGANDRPITNNCRLRWVIGGTVGPSATFTASVATVY